MRETLKNWFGSANPLQAVNFNIAMVFICISYACAFASGLYLHLNRGFYYASGIGMVLLSFFIGYASQSGKYQIAAFAITMIMELVILPGCYIFDGRFWSFILVYYFLVFLMTVFVQDGKLRTIACVVFWISWISVVIYGYYHANATHQSLYGGMNTLIDVVIPLAICAVLSLFCTIASIRYYNLESIRVEQSRIAADETEKSKDIFLMNMSHEIRTPMNAIMSAGEIMLSKDVSYDTRHNVVHITTACRALISTLDDLLVFSRAEEKKIVMQEGDYDLSLFLDDIINMISVRLMGSDVKFYVYIDPYIPRGLHGDVVRLRQVFINILNNAVKYTKTGHIILRVVMSDVTEDRMILHADVEDTGIGIKADVLPTLFEDFTRVADNMNESLKIEGSGLGLSITKNILNSCGGDIKVKSEYNKGSVFSFEVPQKISDREPLAKLKNAGETGVIICDDDPDMSNILMDTLRAMRLKCTIASSTEELNKAIQEGIYTHLFITPECLLASCDLPSLMSANLTVVMMQNVDDSNEEDGDARITKPVNCLNVAHFFENSEKDRAKKKVEASEEEGRKILVKGARALVVEDNLTNLMVAERLLSRMGFEIATANSGNSAVSLAKVMSFDILFIDYMMTGMNGIDTLRAIKRLPDEWTNNVPSIVMTADAHEGAKQMLINAGFDDYLSKPVDMEEMEYMVVRYLPGELLTV